MSNRLSNIPIMAVVGDIHGQLGSLDKAIKILELLMVPAVFVGDYIDRGPNSIACIELLSTKKEEHPDWVFLQGNHESELLMSLRKGSCQLCFDRIGCAFQDYREKGMPIHHHRFLKSLLTSYEVGQVCFVHGHSHRHEDKKIIRGHVPVEKPFETKVDISIDTSPYGHLSVAVLNVSCEPIDHRLLGYFKVFPNGESNFVNCKEQEKL